jgi:hypothetical protein
MDRDQNRELLHAGLSETRDTLRLWRRSPRDVLAWLPRSAAIGCSLLVCTVIVSQFVHVSPGDEYLPIGTLEPAGFSDWRYVMLRNSIVLALHALVAVAVYLARRSIPQTMHLRSGINRFVHERVGSLAMIAVFAATAFSVGLQSIEGGLSAAEVALAAHRPAWLVTVCFLPHALIELTAIFLPLAACLTLVRAERHNQLLAAAAVATAIAIPMLLFAATIETWVTPTLVYRHVLLHH